MSDRPIQAGDLVVVVKNHCTDNGVGLIFRLGKIDENDSFHCRHCRTRLPQYPLLAPISLPYGICWVPLEWLKRIPPLSELEGEKRDEPIKEPA